MPGTAAKATQQQEPVAKNNTDRTKKAEGDALNSTADKNRSKN